MPLYEYEHEGEVGLECERVFELAHGSGELVQVCPVCGGPVKKRVVGFGVAANPLAPSNLKEKGFKRLVRKDKGVYREE